ncbi:glucose-6-phosphate dehydrogenase [Patescibacteria group bacterium]|nr:glucose-6-phosphate dehydrogenase [Patescibacteria group bacterium]
MNAASVISVPPTAIVILGGTGNLAETKLLPALFDLFVRKDLPSAFVVIGLSRKAWGDADYQRYVREAVSLARPHAAQSALTDFAGLARYRRGAFDDALTYEALKEALTLADAGFGQCTNKLFYLAVPPQFYSSIFTQLATSGVMTLCNRYEAWSRVLVEKPFGRDLETAKALEAQLAEQFSEDQIYRIDHYLAKDAIENILALRFGNRVLADSWHRGEVESLAIRVHETKDVATRGSFYDGIGALRDVGQNHVLQILALITMEATALGDVAAMRRARARVLGALTSPTIFVRGQYDGYLDTEGVSTDSRTETYFKVVTTIDVPQWQGVPIFLEAGKALKENRIDAVITFKAKQLSATDGVPHHNVLTITIAPEVRITLRVYVKKPGFAFALEPRELELTHTLAADSYSPEAYARVLYDCIAGDQTRFVSSEEVTAAWQFITPLLASEAPLRYYAVGCENPDDVSDTNIAQ